jgi:hypothetical protein
MRALPGYPVNVNFAKPDDLLFPTDRYYEATT